MGEDYGGKDDLTEVGTGAGRPVSSAGLEGSSQLEAGGEGVYDIYLARKRELEGLRGVPTLEWVSDVLTEILVRIRAMEFPVEEKRVRVGHERVDRTVNVAPLGTDVVDAILNPRLETTNGVSVGLEEGIGYRAMGLIDPRFGIRRAYAALIEATVDVLEREKYFGGKIGPQGRPLTGETKADLAAEVLVLEAHRKLKEFDNLADSVGQ